ncbi:universal stress protein [Caballeronia terrestris]|uniref:Universal stress protein n=2 Tax=Caballeronia TaxID=1827195 RepID=A0A158L0M2_9BURK|nr:universal stress protein [Caballeronia humi]SAL86902.1 universal stress protein [Caballeronia terrestris]
MIDLPPVSGGDASAAFYVNTRDGFAQESAALDADASVRMHQAGVRGGPRVVEVELTRDDIAHRILKSAQEFGADLVVMGTHGRRLALGSVAEHFLRISCCPVLLVPAPKGELPAEAASEKLDPQTPH